MPGYIRRPHCPTSLSHNKYYPKGDTGEAGKDGDPGPNQVSTETCTDLSGILQGDGSRVGVAAPDVDYRQALTSIEWMDDITGTTGGTGFLDGKEITIAQEAGGAVFAFRDDSGPDLEFYRAESSEDATDDPEWIRAANWVTGLTPFGFRRITAALPDTISVDSILLKDTSGVVLPNGSLGGDENLEPVSHDGVTQGGRKLAFVENTRRQVATVQRIAVSDPRWVSSGSASILELGRVSLPAENLADGSKLSFSGSFRAIRSGTGIGIKTRIAWVPSEFIDSGDAAAADNSHITVLEIAQGPELDIQGRINILLDLAELPADTSYLTMRDGTLFPDNGRTEDWTTPPGVAGTVGPVVDSSYAPAFSSYPLAGKAQDFSLILVGTTAAHLNYAYDLELEVILDNWTP